MVSCKSCADYPDLHSFPTRRSSDLNGVGPAWSDASFTVRPPLKIIAFSPPSGPAGTEVTIEGEGFGDAPGRNRVTIGGEVRSEEHTSELQSQSNIVCRLLLEKKNY